MRLLLPMTLIAVLAVALAAGCGESEAPTATTTVSTGQKICPVMGNAINPNIFVDYKGRRVYFCCPMCPPKFNADPEKYIKILDEQMKSGAATPSAPAATATAPMK